MKLDTLNIVEMRNDDLVAVHAYFNTDEGAIDADEKFCELIRIDGATDDEVDFFLEEGFYENGPYQVFLKTSDVEPIIEDAMQDETAQT